MIRVVVLAVAAVALAVLAISQIAGSGSAASDTLPDWAPLAPGCYDVSGDGDVDLPNDILGVILKFSAQWGDDEYALVFDQNGDGVIDMPNDLLPTILAFNDPLCGALETQLVASAAALLPYQNCQDAVADGYEPGGVYVPGMGIHISNYDNLRTQFDPNDPVHLAKPFGIVCSRFAAGDPLPASCTDASPPIPASMCPNKLIGPWYIVPNPETGGLYELLGAPVSPPYQPDNVQPAMFEGDSEDTHQHTNLCVGPGFLNELGNIPDPDGVCASLGGIINIGLYGWMTHLYNFVPNPSGNFVRWNFNDDFPVCGYGTVATC